MFQTAGGRELMLRSRGEFSSRILVSMSLGMTFSKSHVPLFLSYFEEDKKTFFQQTKETIDCQR